MAHHSSHAPGGWKSSLATILKRCGGYTQDGQKVVSYATQQARREHLFKAISDIRELGYKIRDVQNLKEKHIRSLLEHYTTQADLKPATIQNRLSHLRTLSFWIKKPNLIKAASHYTQKPLNRHYVAQEDKSWRAKGVDTADKIAAIRLTHPRLADLLEAQALFGLRFKEAALLRPHLADKNNYLLVSHGTKGGRDRTVPIETTAQRTYLDRIKSTYALNGSLVSPDSTYTQFRQHCYYILRQHGITRLEGITTHHLRHQYLNDVYEQVTKNPSPVRGGQLRQENRALDQLGRQEVAQRAGHNREDIAAAYLGGKTIV